MTRKGKIVWLVVFGAWWWAGGVLVAGVIPAGRPFHITLLVTALLALGSFLLTSLVERVFASPIKEKR